MKKDSYTIMELGKECRFCTLPDKDRIIYEGEDFIVMLSLGPVVKGYSLIIPKNHITCYGMLSEEKLYELDNIKEVIKEAFYKKYGSDNVLFFEHGNVGSSISKIPSDNHAHIHCVSIDNKSSMILQVKEKIRVDPVAYDSYENFIKDYKKNRKDTHYLLVEEKQQLYVFYVENIKIESQFLRKRLAEITETDLEKADWMKNPEWKSIEKEKDLLRKYMYNSYVETYKDSIDTQKIYKCIENVKGEEIKKYITIYSDLYKKLNIDSLELIQVIIELEKEFDIILEPEDVTYHNFKNIYLINKLMRKYERI